MTNTQSNVTPIESHQVVPTSAKFTIQASIDGFPIQVEVDGKADALRTMIDRLKAIGAEPPQVQTPAQAKPAGVPVCPVHNAPMKEGRRGYFCPKKVGDGYCKETV